MKQCLTFLLCCIAIILGMRCTTQTAGPARINTRSGSKEQSESPSQAQIERAKQILYNVDTLQDPVKKKKQLEEAYSLVSDKAEDSLINTILFQLAFNANISGDWAKGYEWAMAGMDRIGSDSQSVAYAAFANMIAQSFEKQRDYISALDWAQKAIRTARPHSGNSISSTNRWASRMGAAKYMAWLHYPLDSCLYFARESIRLGKLDSLPEILFANSYASMAIAFEANDRPDSAIAYFHQALATFNKIGSAFASQETERYLARVFLENHRSDSALYYAQKAYEGAPGVNNWDVRMDAANILSSALENTDKALSLAYLKEYLHLKDSLFNRDKFNEIALIKTNEQLKARDAAEKERQLRSRIITFSLLAGLALMAITGLSLYRNNQVRKKTNEQLAHKNRELEIESAMDKIRSRSLAMHRSDEIRDVTGVMFTQLNELGIHCLTIAIQIFDFQTMDSVFWPGNTLASAAPKVILPYDENMMQADSCHRDLWEAMKDGKVIFNKAYTREQKDRWFDYVFAHNDASVIHEDARQFIRNAEKHIVCFVPEKHSALFADTFDGSRFSAKDLEIFKRAARVFDQAYVRFLDLQKAEAQAYEAQVETALEKVRSKSLAMQQSSELEQVAIALFDGLAGLGVSMNGALVFVFNHETKDINLWVATTQLSKPINISLPHDVAYSSNEILQEFWTSTQNRGTGLNRIFSKEAQHEYFQYVHKYNAHKIPEEIIQIQQTSAWNFSYASEYHTMIGVDSWTGQLFSETHLDTLKSFSRVFEQAYIRFLDLQKAEYQAREAVKQASLDRVRGEIASMRSDKDLDRITPLVWTELHKLGIRFSRCGIFIVDIPNQEVNIFLSSPEGKSIAAFDLDFRKINLQEVVEHWQKHAVFVTHWSPQQFAELADILVQERIISDQSHYLHTLPETGLYLHYIPFLQGMLYVAHTESLGKDELELVQSLADSFSVAYARYEDFTRMEAAKLQTEQALHELKQTQAQLVQAEKMASLGELTAGIAHEIQNPLNFVNNFSDLNKELIEELQEELKKGDVREASSIAENLKDNEDKINLHGRRADGIVKSMLQHSRASGGQKEPTDVNKLVDEYVRLAYHGYRARKKDFNVTLDIQLDPELGKVPMVAQDIGRVILNLLNNAFQAVEEKAKTAGADYQPTVTVTTKARFAAGDPGLLQSANPQSVIRNLSSIVIAIEDNGPGIPDAIKDKIFQPFFTTKPTGQGTGLGLSLSYDIVKAHGGLIELSDGQPSGSVFQLLLPATGSLQA